MGARRSKPANHSRPATLATTATPANTHRPSAFENPSSYSPASRYTARTLLDDAFYNQCRKFNIRLTREEESQLAALAAAGCTESFQRLVESQTPLVIKLATEAHRRCGVGSVEMVDLVQQGLLSLASSIKTFDLSRSRLTTYTCLVVKQKIQSYVWQNASVIYRPSNPSTYSAANRQRADKVQAVVSLDRANSDEFGESDGNELIDTLYIEAPDEIESIDTSELLVVLQNEIDRLPSRERYIIRKRLERKTLDQIGELLGGISKERVRQIESKAVRMLRKAMGVKVD